MERAVVPVAVAILIFLFVIQRKGTSWIGGIFGPIMLIWFVVGALGIVGITKAPAVPAFDPPEPDEEHRNKAEDKLAEEAAAPNPGLVLR
jgi:KUP system potassium uptake protein